VGGSGFRSSTTGSPGALVGDLLPGGPADRAGLQPGDRILAMNGEPIISVRGLLDRVTRRSPGETIELTGERAASSVQWQVMIAERPTNLEPVGPQQPPLR